MLSWKKHFSANFSVKIIVWLVCRMQMIFCFVYVALSTCADCYAQNLYFSFFEFSFVIL